jgi:adenylate cyclase
MGAVENESMGRREITVGETVMIASQLEAATRRLLSDVIVSAETVAATGRSFPGLVSYKIAIKGRDKPMQVYGFGGVPEKLVPDKAEDEAPRGKGAAKTEADDGTG